MATLLVTLSLLKPSHTHTPPHYICSPSSIIIICFLFGGQQPTEIVTTQVQMTSPSPPLTDGVRGLNGWVSYVLLVGGGRRSRCLPPLPPVKSLPCRLYVHTLRSNYRLTAMVWFGFKRRRILPMYQASQKMICQFDKSLKITFTFSFITVFWCWNLG